MVVTWNHAFIFPRAFWKIICGPPITFFSPVLTAVSAKQLFLLQLRDRKQKLPQGAQCSRFPQSSHGLFCSGVSRAYSFRTLRSATHQIVLGEPMSKKQNNRLDEISLLVCPRNNFHFVFPRVELPSRAASCSVSDPWRLTNHDDGALLLKSAQQLKHNEQCLHSKLEKVLSERRIHIDPGQSERTKFGMCKFSWWNILNWDEAWIFTLTG